MSDIQNLPCKKLLIRQAVQPREELDDELVQSFAELLMEDPEFQFEPVVAFQTPRNGDLIVADGFHRVAGYKTAERTLIPVLVHEGDEGDASWYALTANSRHGKPLNRQETYDAVVKALDHRNRKELSFAQLGKLFGRAERTIYRINQEYRKAPEKKKTSESSEREQKEKFSPEVIEAIDKIGSCLPNAKVAILNGSIKKPEDELIAFAELDCETQTKLASYFFTHSMTLKGAMNAAAKRPSDIDAPMRDFIQYTQLRGVGQTWYFHGDTVSVEVTLLVETPEEEVTKPIKSKAISVPEGLI